MRTKGNKEIDFVNLLSRLIDCLFGFRMIKKEERRENKVIKKTVKKMRLYNYKSRTVKARPELALDSINHNNMIIMKICANSGLVPKIKKLIKDKTEKEIDERKKDNKQKKEIIKEVKEATNKFMNHGIESHMELWCSSIINNDMNDVPIVLIKFYI
jgi:hypothetical protein